MLLRNWRKRAIVKHCISLLCNFSSYVQIMTVTGTKISIQPQPHTLTLKKKREKERKSEGRVKKE